MKGTRLSAEVRERGGPAVANEIALDGISCFGVPLEKSEGERERIIEALFTAALLVLHNCYVASKRQTQIRKVFVLTRCGTVTCNTNG